MVTGGVGFLRAEES